MGAGDVKLLMGVGAWVHGATTFYAFCLSGIVGAVLAVLMVLMRGVFTKHYFQFWAILGEIATIRDPEKLSAIAAQRKSSMMLLPYGIPIAIGTIAYFAWTGNAGMRYFGVKDGATSQAGEMRNTEKQLTTLRRGRLNMHKVCGSFRKQRGAAAVEFAVVAPIFVLLLFGMIEYGRMVMVQQMLTNATREGARRAVLDGTTLANVKTTVRDYLTSGNITVYDNEITVTPDPSAAANGDPVTVSTTVPFSRVSWLPSPMFLGSANMTATSVMRRESVQ